MSRAAPKYHAASLTDDVSDVEGGVGGCGGEGEINALPAAHFAQQDFIPFCLPAPVQENLRRNHPRVMPCLMVFALVLCVFVAGFRVGEEHEMNLLQNTQAQPQQPQLGVAIPSAQEEASSIEAHSSTASNPEKFLVFAEQRTGSRFLTDLLDDHPGVRCGNEELNHPGSAVEVKDTTLDEYMGVLEDTWARLWSTGGNHNHKAAGQTAARTAKAVGFKAMYNQGPMYYGDPLLSLLDENDVRVIHLVRRNKLMQYISTEANQIDKKHAAKAEVEGAHNAHPHTEEEAKKLRQITVSGKPNKVLHFMRQKTEEDAKVSELIESNVARDHFEIVHYEDLSDHTQTVTARLFDLLGVDDEREVKTDMTKIHKDMPTRNYFKEEQREALREALEQSEFAWVLDGW